MAKLCATLMDNAEQSDSESSSELDDEEYAEKLKELHDLRVKAETKEATMKDEEEESDEEEEDLEVKDLVVDYTLYYSPLDLIHELYYVKKKLEELGRKDMALYKQLEQGLNKEELESFHKAMAEADRLQKEIEEENA
jgi:hypothetical protein